jgi:hypothetical protein
METEITAVWDLPHWPRDIYPQKLALTSRTSGGRSVGIVRSQTKAAELLLLLLLLFTFNPIAVKIPLLCLVCYLVVYA